MKDKSGKVIIDEITPLVDEAHIDRMGNVIGYKKGTNPKRKVNVLCPYG